MAERFILVLMVAVLAGCVTQEPVTTTDKYHQPGSGEVQSKPLNGLQLKGFKYMNQGDHRQSIQYFQRAIKIEPRNPLNWHYLAQNYYHLGDFETCQAMIRRSSAYGQLDEDLQRANRALMDQCTR